MVDCKFCGCDTTPTLVDRLDYEYGVQEQLDYFKCRRCGLVFADSVPRAKVPSFYATYSTHGQIAKSSVLSRMADRQTMSEMLARIGDNRNARILDYGCGGGAFLTRLAEQGYRNAVGFDFDPVAVREARRHGHVIIDDESDIAGPFDVITMNHVIEHLIDPIEDIARLSKLLLPTGKIVARTPNSESGLSARFGSDWRGWETPRHLHIFAPRTFWYFIDRPELAHLSADVATSNAMFFGIFHGSMRAPRWRTGFGKIARHVSAFAMRLMPYDREELVVTISHHNTDNQAPAAFL